MTFRFSAAACVRGSLILSLALTFSSTDLVTVCPGEVWPEGSRLAVLVGDQLHPADDQITRTKQETR